MRPTGRLHIGHYFGALQNWVRLQNDPAYECFYFIADWHALTSDYADTSAVAENTLQIMIDYLAAGLDPEKEKCVVFQQSLVPEHAELHLLLSMVTPLGWLERVPTYKEALENVRDRDLHNYGFLGYPILQCADIVIYGEPGAQLYVPVGEDQVSHVELSREIVRRFNGIFAFKVRDEIFERHNKTKLESVLRSTGVTASTSLGLHYPFSDEEKVRFKIDIVKRIVERGIANYFDLYPQQKELFVHERLLREPESMLTPTPRIPGTDGRKMSKSYNNSISLSESNESIWEKVRRMMTDPARKRRENPGNPEICPVYDWHKLFSPNETLEWANEGCRTAGIGCIECKRAMADNLITWIAPIRERRLQYQHQKKLVRQLILEGSVQARVVAQKTMIQVRDAVLGKNRIRRRNLRPIGKSSAG
jgi:tryptophanyl-tRNA synthetase